MWTGDPPERDREANYRIGILSDTHGLLRPEVLAALAGSDLILHAGDAGGAGILEALSRLAPVEAVRGNVDRGDWAVGLPAVRTVEVGGARLLLVHDLSDLNLDPAAAGYRAVIFGHSHKPDRAMRGEVLYLNPGSAGPRRFRLPVTMARLCVRGGRLEPEIVFLPVAGGRRRNPNREESD